MRIGLRNSQVGRAGKRLGIAAFVFFLVKGLVWVAVGVAGYSAWAS